MMKINLIRSDQVYQRVLSLPAAERQAYFRQELLAPFKPKFYKQGIPYEAKTAGAFDIMQLLSWMHRMPDQLTAEDIKLAEALDDAFWQNCERTLTDNLAVFKGQKLPVRTYTFTALLANPDAPMLKINQGYSGDGGIPGYIFLSLVPAAETLRRVPAAIAHEVNHNVRYQFVDWDGGSLREMLVAEGLAENFAESLYGRDKLGPWVTTLDKETIRQQVKPVLRAHLDLSGLQKITPYLYGDEIAAVMGQEGAGLPYCAGYACGYYLVRYFLEKTGTDLAEATLLPAHEILNEVEDFWTKPIP